MVAKHSPMGLIATTRAEVTPPLDDLVASCGWPLVLDANPRRLASELSLHNPECVLFWLEDQHGVAATARLVAWSRERGSRPYRVAIAYRMEADIEAIFRAAGAHSFLPVSDRSASGVADALRPLLRDSARHAVAQAAGLATVSAASDQVSATGSFTELVRPP
jgi:hypothetical protein